MAELPTYITLEEAARCYHLSQQMLTRAVENGIIRAVKVNGGIIAVAEGDVRVMSKREELWEQVKHLDGVPISVNDAAARYRLSTGSLTRWISAGYIRVLHPGDPRGGRGRKTLLNEADVAYAKLVAGERQSKPGRRVFTREFLPAFLSA
jgi:predicted site-specific integrase-resolvase